MTMKKSILLIAATALLSVAAGYLVCRFLQDEPQAVGPNVGMLQSTILNERREYFVHLPDGYGANTNARYAVLYVLDAAEQVNHTAESASLLARVGVIPPVIVVGIPNVSRNTRGRDFTPPDNWASSDAGSGARRFMAFLEQELIPKIEADYRTARPRMLAGWSLGGLFVLYSQVASPSLFDGRFAHSSHLWGTDDPTVNRIQESFKTSKPTSGFLFVSLGSEEAGEMKEPFQKLVQMLETNFPSAPEKSSTGFRWQTHVSAGGTHDTTPVLATPLGLCVMFSPGTGQGCRALQ